MSFNLSVTIVVLLFAGLACSGESTKEATAEVVGSLVESEKGIADGVAEGSNRGRERVEGTTGARTLTDSGDIHDEASFEVLENRASALGTELVLAVGTEAEQPLHLAGLRREGNAVLLDRDGFASGLVRGDDDIEVPANARVRVTLVFAGDPAGATKLRLWGTDFDVPPPVSEGDESSPDEGEDSSER